MYNCMACPYVDGARGPFEFDCLGIVRELMHEALGCSRDLIPAFGGVSCEAGNMHECYEEIEKGFKEVGEPEHGAIVAVFDDSNCFRHVGLFLEGSVYHSTIKSGPAILSLRQFRHFGKLRFYVSA